MKKKIVNENKRRLGTIKKVFYGVEDHGIRTVWLTIDFGYFVQDFGGLTLGLKSKTVASEDYMKSICRLFNVKNRNDLVGKKCYALWSFGDTNEYIEGIEALDGQRFTNTSWRRKHFKDVKNPLIQRKERLRTDIIYWKQKIINMKKELRGLDKRFTDWG